MISLEICLRNILTALQNDVAPTLTNESAKSTTASIIRLLARMIANAPDALTPIDVSTPNTHLLTEPKIEKNQSTSNDPRSVIDSLNKLINLAGHEKHILNTVESLVAELSNGTQTDQPSNNSNQTNEQRHLALEQYLRQKFNCDAVKITNFRLLVGGRSKQTVLFNLEGLSEFSGTCVLRIDGTINLSGGKSVLFEYPLQKQLSNYGLKVPYPYLVESNKDILGQPFMIVEYMSGKMAGGYFSPPSSHSLLADYAGELARLHAIPIEQYANIDMPQTPRTRQELKEEIDNLEKMWVECSGPPSFVIQGSIAWLKENIELAYRGTACLAHCDALFHNVLTDGTKLTALLDWELARISYAAEDLGYIRATIPLVMDWSEFMQHYETVANQTIDQQQVDYYAILLILRNCVMASNVRRLVAGKESNDVELTSVSLHDLYAMIYQLSEHLERATNNCHL